MAEPFKNLVGPELVRTLARHLTRVDDGFPQRRFTRRALAGLEDLELKARVTHVAAALEEALPPDFAAACDLLERSLAPARDDDDLSQLEPSEHGLAGWVVWPMTEFVANKGLAEPDRALVALHAMTQRNTAEYAIRPFLIEHRERTMRALRRWLEDPSPHVRRLVSEGSRPRLPWGVRLDHLVRDPAPTLPLLEALQDDTSEYVRRSVANHLNDIAKDHPAVVADWLERHLPGAGPDRRRMLRHASRTLLKRGDRRVLDAWGVGAPLRGDASLSIEPAVVAIGGAMTLHVELTSRARVAQELLVDYVVHHRRSGGATSAKTWKGWRFELAAGASERRSKRHSWKPVTTRRDHVGEHRVELLVNGRVVADATFELRRARG